MKTLLLRLLPLVLVLWSIGAGAAPPAPTPGAPLAGTVLEVKDVDQYTYLRLRTKEGEVWAAVPTAPVKVGADVSIANPQAMNGFHSKTLNKTFDRIVFGTLAGRGEQAAPPDHAAMHAPAGKAPAVPPVKVEKAKGPNAQTVAGIVTGAASLKDKPVTVRGQVVKFTADVMGKNWLHLRDGTGSSSDGSDDVLVVTGNTANVGDVVLVSGTVRTDRNLGSGYSYKVLIEEAKLTK
jgi:hypothetical protein